ncbi:MAG: amino acid ABC transporter substrate-binding protein [Proteobacteria bacterium]|nr:amino acid ABC transporter substrate-binding protein [Pseudomonadota bacterium]
MHKLGISTGLALAVGLALTPGAAKAGATFEAIKARGVVTCGVNTGVAGFSIPDTRGAWSGIDIDLCRAFAAAMFADASKTKYVPLTAAQRFTALQSGEIDVLTRNTTITLVRDGSMGLLLTGINFYDGQGFMVKQDLKVKSVKELNGATICAAQGTTHELNMADYFRSNKLTYKPVVIENQDQMYEAFFAGRCDAMTQDSSALAAVLAAKPQIAGSYMILPERISKEPLGPMVRQDDMQWFAVVKWALAAMIEGEEKGVTQANADQMLTSDDPGIKRLLGVTEGNGKALGLNEKWAHAILKQVGNYGESFERNVGKASALKLERGVNDLWTRGGLMYALPLR